MNLFLKRVLMWGALALGILLIINSWLYKRALTKAELVNNKLKIEAVKKDKEKADILAAAAAFEKDQKAKIEGMQKSADEKAAQAAGIISNSASQIFAIRGEKKTLESKYAELENDALKKVEKIKLLESSNSDLQMEIIDWRILEASRLDTIAKLNFLIDDPKAGYKVLLKRCTDNADSIIKPNRSIWGFIRERVAVVAGYGVNSKGDFAWQLTAGFKVL